MPNHWFFKDGNVEFQKSITEIIGEAATHVCQQDARNTLGDEHEQCQYLFTKTYTLMQERHQQLTRHLLLCSKIPDPVVELRYYRSRRKRDQSAKDPQFVEKETGADFALTLNIDLPGVLQAERSVLGQAKIITPPSSSLDIHQLNNLLRQAGSESACYLLWQVNRGPVVVTADNVVAHVRNENSKRLYSSLLNLGQPLADFFCNAFIGLWFGKDYEPTKYGEKPPQRSIPILYHFLHRNAPPPNVAYFGLSTHQRTQIPAGVYVNEIVDID
jgi:hypothetical protein